MILKSNSKDGKTSDNLQINNNNELYNIFFNLISSLFLVFGQIIGRFQVTFDKNYNACYKHIM